ncbi:uncharacterized protein Bfra_009456 [Botrytis fragariae]|uniref:DUF6594 domain-containing protein n=1 Tax=Botrytis fragariae TaxID=1964551 RepID=A0A8H6EG48_9HELO|nr:uncharacterized protein Bfra_009456 [Botrytis fragariae]KAF5870901.1 hypothetical protein Bfra_009456 [Botrytis fragariae]
MASVPDPTLGNPFLINMPKEPGVGIIKNKMSEAERLFHYSYATLSEESCYLAFPDAIRDYASLSGLQNIAGSQAQEKRHDLTYAFLDIAGLPGDPFNSAYRRLPDQSLIPREQLLRTDEYLKGEPPEQVSLFVDKLARFIVAFAGGLSLVAPMLIMRIEENLTKSLVTTSIAVVLFAGMTSLILRANNTETVAATATYATLLMVFVGTNG